VAEASLGLSLLVGTLIGRESGLLHTSALGLLALCVAITPANIYMWTHGARLPLSQPSPPPFFHLIRFAVQALLFALFLDLGTINI
jgi:uncharacterized membrane protein